MDAGIGFELARTVVLVSALASLGSLLRKASLKSFCCRKTFVLNQGSFLLRKNCELRS
jgi:hypothetical protein